VIEQEEARSYAFENYELATRVVAPSLLPKKAGDRV
jgi:hypothetical protein